MPRATGVKLLEVIPMQKETRVKHMERALMQKDTLPRPRVHVPTQREMAQLLTILQHTQRVVVLRLLGHGLMRKDKQLAPVAPARTLRAGLQARRDNTLMLKDRQHRPWAKVAILKALVPLPTIELATQKDYILAPSIVSTQVVNLIP